MGRYEVRQLNKPIDAVVRVPGSKSITNRALLISAFCDGKSHLENVLFSDDTEVFIDSVRNLGIKADIEGQDVIVSGQGMSLPKREADIYTGSAGTASRFLSAALALSEGDFLIDASEQMKKRPMKPLFDALNSMGSRITCMEQEGFLPARVGLGEEVIPEVSVDSDISTQFLSALLLSAPLVTKKTGKDFVIRVEGTRADGAYVKMTCDVMKDFGVLAERTPEGFRVAAGQSYKAKTYRIEPDVSAACYFYGAAAVSGGKVIVEDVHLNSIQGDIKFLNVLEQMGCRIKDTDRGVEVTGPADGKLSGVDIDMRDFSDQTMTLAAIAPFCETPVTVRNVAHIRKQESDRISAICTELTRLGIKVEENEDGFKIYPGNVNPGVVQTYNDHRIAMAFSLTGLRSGGVVIDDYECCSKTFKEYFEVLEKIY